MIGPHTSLIPFFLFSLSLHLLLFFPWSYFPGGEKTAEPIPVSFLPSPEEQKTKPFKAPKEPRRRPSQAFKVAKKSTRLTDEPAKAPRNLPETERRREEPESDKPELREKDTLVHRPLPTLKELLPPATLSPSEGGRSNREEAVRLDTREPKYVSYLTSVKRAIELVWEYPEPALRHRLQGRLILEFRILGNGNLERTQLVRSSGFPVLDQEAIRAVEAAAPFHPIPPWVGKTRLDIIASFEYYDNRLKYGFVP